MVELKIDQKLPETVSFKDELGLLVTVGVEYEWKPVSCANCQGMRHHEEECRRTVPKLPQKPIVKQVWRLVAKRVEGSLKPVETRSSSATIPVRKEPTIQVLDGEGEYSPNQFGSVSYRDALSPSQQLYQTNDKDPNIAQSHG
ncbi:hypothetical protein vseg_020962 [Gypsophila vaccaria]